MVIMIMTNVSGELSTHSGFRVRAEHANNQRVSCSHSLTPHSSLSPTYSVEINQHKFFS